MKLLQYKSLIVTLMSQDFEERIATFDNQGLILEAYVFLELYWKEFFIVILSVQIVLTNKVIILEGFLSLVIIKGRVQCATPIKRLGNGKLSQSKTAKVGSI